MWGAVHSLLYYCSVSTLGYMIASNRETNFNLGQHCITEADASAINGALELLPKFEAKMSGWNLHKAEIPSVGEAGRDAKFEFGSGRFYKFSDIQNDEFVVPPLDRWPGWTRPNLISMYMTRFGIRPEPKARPMKVETSVASGAAGTPVVPEFLKHQQAQQGQPSSGSSARLEPYDPTNDEGGHKVIARSYTAGEA